MPKTPSQRLAGLLLDEPLEAYLQRGRDAGKPWRVIARDLFLATDGEVDVAPETLRLWHLPANDSAVAS